jgi:hypothetical protein
VIGWWKQSDECSEGLAPLWVPQVVAPAGGAAVATGVVAGQSLLVTAEHPRNLQGVREIHVRQHRHQLAQVPWRYDAATRLLVL